MGGAKALLLPDWKAEKGEDPPSFSSAVSWGNMLLDGGVDVLLLLNVTLLFAKGLPAPPPRVGALPLPPDANWPRAPLPPGPPLDAPE